jgi:hypothetical protein
MAADVDFDIPGPIGIQDIEVEQQFTRINTNRTLIVASLNSEGPFDPEILSEENTSSLSKLFEFAKPNVTVELETGNEENPVQEQAVNYSSLKDFRADELEKRIPILQKQRSQEARLLKIMAEFERSKRLQDIVKDPHKKAGFLDILESIREELEDIED